MAKRGGFPGRNAGNNDNLMKRLRKCEAMKRTRKH